MSKPMMRSKPAAREVRTAPTMPPAGPDRIASLPWKDRKSTRLNSSHSQISYAVFCLKKKEYSDVRSAHSVHCTARLCIALTLQDTGLQFNSLPTLPQGTHLKLSAIRVWLLGDEPASW